MRFPRLTAFGDKFSAHPNELTHGMLVVMVIVGFSTRAINTEKY